MILKVFYTFRWVDAVAGMVHFFYPPPLLSALLCVPFPLRQCFFATHVMSGQGPLAWCWCFVLVCLLFGLVFLVDLFFCWGLDFAVGHLRGVLFFGVRCP